MECKVGQWQDINGYNGFYQVNKCGDVKSLARSVKTKGNKIKENMGCEEHEEMDWNTNKYVFNGIQEEDSEEDDDEY